MRLYGEVLKTCSRDLLSSFRRSRTLGIKQLWVAWLVRPPGDSWDCSSMKWQDIWTHYTETAGGGGGASLPIRPRECECSNSNRTRESSNWRPHSLPSTDQPPHSMESLNWKMRKSIPKEIHKFLKERSTLSVFEVASEVHPSGPKPELSSICPVGMDHIFTKCKS